MDIKNVELLYKHIEFSTNEEISLIYAKKIIRSKVQNSIVMLQRWLRFNFIIKNELEEYNKIIEELKEYLKKIDKSVNKEELR